MMDARITQEFAFQLVSYACGRYSGGRTELDPIYQVVTEGRDVGAVRRSYSSCGDLAHWLLYRLGSRLKLVNREENGGWRLGRNISNLAFSTLTEVATDADVYEPGDTLIIWSRRDTTDAHVMVVLEHSEQALVTGEYGQPGGAVRRHLLLEPRMIGRRKIHRVLRLNKVLESSHAHDKLREPDFTALPQAQAYLVDHQEQLPIEFRSAAPPIV